MHLDRQTALTMMSNLLEIRRKRGLSSAADPVSFYGFTPDEILCVHFWKKGQEGTWFRLRDSRVIDDGGHPSETDMELYMRPNTSQPLLM